MNRRFYLVLTIAISTLISCTDETAIPSERDEELNFHVDINRTWIGPSFWANRLQDWQVKNGALRANFAGPNRRVFFLDRSYSGRGDFSMTSDIQFDSQLPEETECKVGFELGISGEFNDYRDDAIHGKGQKFLVDPRGSLHYISQDTSIVFDQEIASDFSVVSLQFASDDSGKITFKSSESDSSVNLDFLDQEDLAGGIGIVSDCIEGGKLLVANFKSTRLSGSGIDSHEDRRWGPVLWTQYTLSQNSLSLTAQLAPIGFQESQHAYFEANKSGSWVELARSEIDEDARIAHFRISDWNASDDTEFRIAYDYTTASGDIERRYWNGTIRKDPVDANLITIAGFTGNNDIGFPNNELVENVQIHDPDFLFFSGDQLYERVGGFGVQRHPIEDATLDYLRKWYMYGWAYKELMRDRPTVSITDDHDVYHGNIWGAEGRAAVGAEGYEAQDSGGYKMPPRWVRMVEKTQTSNLPLPVDPAPIQQGIGTYFTNIEYGGISFAVIEDRKFKSAPKVLVPEGNVINGWPQTPNFDSKNESDVPNAKLLGQRQLDFLENWSAEWTDQAVMKMVLSQTIFANVATLPNGTRDDKIVPKLRILNKDDYPPDDQPVQDHDSNAWPQTGRNNALKAMRKSFALHLAGDQHLGSTIQYGIDEYRDAAFALCVPAISNLWPRRWYPSKQGENRTEGSPRYAGDFEDGFGNKISVHAVSNPVYSGKVPSDLYDRATGYGIVRIDKSTHDFVLESWPRDVSPVDGAPYEGWPVQANQIQNYGKTPSRSLESISYESRRAPVFQLVNKSSNEIVYTIRPGGTEFAPAVFSDDPHELRKKELGSTEWEVILSED